jgi:hypothetical protein
MAVTFVFDTIVFANLISIGLTVQSYTYSAFPKALQLDCLRNTPIIYSFEECEPFYNSGRTAGLRLFWEAYFTAMRDKSKFQVLSTIEAGLCCGFFSPFSCTANTAKFPSNRLTKGISGALLNQRVTCGPFPDYYPQQSNCVDYKDFAASPPLIGGCEYDLGVGFCLDVVVLPETSGCASATEDYVVALIAPHAVLLVLCSLFNAIFMLFACCMWWKRKETDIFPEFITEHKTSVQYRNVADQFVVVPRRDLLRKEGFLPKVLGYDELSHLDDEEKGGDEGGSIASGSITKKHHHHHHHKNKHKIEADVVHHSTENGMEVTSGGDVEMPSNIKMALESIQSLK